MGNNSLVWSDAGTGAATGAGIGSIIPGVGTVIGGAVGGIVGGVYGLIEQSMEGGGTSSPDSRSATPTQAQTNTTALQSQLASESAAAVYGNQIVSGQGLLNEPTTTSRVLLGS